MQMVSCFMKMGNLRKNSLRNNQGLQDFCGLFLKMGKEVAKCPIFR